MFKHIKTHFFVVIGIIAFCSCKKETPVLEEGNAKVRFVNTYLNADPQDFYQNNGRLTKQPLAYGMFSEYLEVVGGKSTFWSKNAVEEKATSVIDAVLYNDNAYTLFYYENEDSKPAMVGYINQKSTPTAGKFKVRFVNLSVMFNGKPLVVKEATNTILEGLTFAAQPSYIELSLGTEIKVNVKDNTVLTAIPPATFQAGKTYLIWFDSLDGTSVSYHVVPQE